MENKKLIKILLKDMGELEELIGEVKLNQRFDALEMEFIHTRAKGLQQLLQLLDSKDAPIRPERKNEQEKEEKLKDPVEEVVQKTEQITEGQEKEKEENIQPKMEDNEDMPGKKVLGKGEDKKVPEARSQGEKDEMLEEDPPGPEKGGRLGDSFLKGKSVNDLITDQYKLEYKLSNRPVSSIQAAIGINDRFQYIRELFDGNNDKFTESVKALDSMQNIQEAVDYLRNNFKWKKNETSLKFVNLVKRRFQNAAD
jgi:hypothetical protein